MQRLWPFVSREPFLRGGLLLFAALVVGYLWLDQRFPGGPGAEYTFEVEGSRYVGQYYPWFDDLWYLILIPYAALCVLCGRPSLPTLRERRFWALLAIGLGFWFVSHLLTAVNPRLDDSALGLAQSDVLFLLFYLSLVTAIDLRPDRTGPLLLRRAPIGLEVAGTVIFTFGLLTYFVIVPYLRGGSVDYWTFVNSYFLYITIDVYFVVRLLYLTLAAESPRWRAIYAVLAASWAFLLSINTLELFSYLPTVELYLPTRSGPLWFAPLFGFALAARLRAAPFPVSAPELPRAPRPARLVVFTLALPALHLLLYGSGLLELETRELRDQIVFVYLLAMGSLAQRPHRARRKHNLVIEAERRQALDDLQRSARDYRGLFENAHDAILIFHIEQQEILEVNARACELYGLPREKFLGREPAVLSPDPEWVRDLVQALQRGTVHNLECVHMRADGSELVVDVNAAEVEYGGERAVLCINRDVTARKRSEQQLLYDALHDPLTELANRSFFLERVGLSIERRRRSPAYRYAVLFLDLDRFKHVNDSLGHLVGDKLLVAVAERLRDCLRSVDTAARLGGDEFAVLLDGIQDSSYGTQVAERIHRALSTPFDLDGEEVFTSASIGIALGGGDYESAEEVLRDADVAMYRAKEDPGSFYSVFDRVMHDRAMARLEVESGLRRALEQDELEVHYQPIVELESRRIVALEALVRWRHPQLGVVLPGEFLPVAEESGLGGRIGLWVIAEVCRQLNCWRAECGDTLVAIHVNLTARDLQRPELVPRVAAALEEEGVSASDLHFELTEAALMSSVEAAGDTLTQIQELGLHLHIDDFGTGYSSLGQLQRFAIDSLKIDRAIVAAVEDEAEQRELVAAVVAMARKLGPRVTAEGVETEEQVATLRRLGCELGQGFLFFRPLLAEQVPALLRPAETA